MWIHQAVLLLAACTVAEKHVPSLQGDGGVTVRADGARAADAAVPDTQPPRLLDVQPPLGGMWRHSPIHLTFDEALDPVSVMATTVTASFSEDLTAKHDDITAAIAFEAPASVVLALEHVPKEQGTLKVTVSPTIADVAGNAIVQPLEFVVQLQ